MKRMVCLALAGLLSFNLFGCGAKVADDKAPAKTESKDVKQEANQKGDEATKDAKDENGFHEVTDHGGRKVKVPNKINRIVIDQIPILSTYMAYWQGKAPYIVGYAGSFKDTIEKTVLKDIAPELNDAQNPTYQQGELNIEEVIKLKPDVIFFNINNKEHMEILEKSGIPAIGFATVGKEMPADPTKIYMQWLRLLEQVFNEPGKMDKMNDYGQKMMKEVEDKIATVPEADRPTAMILFQYVQGKIKVAGKGVFGDYWLQHLGVKNVAEDTKGFADATIEQISSWNPDILFLNGPGLLNLTTEQVLANKVEGTDFAPLKAVQDKRVYNTKLGMWNWFTPSPDAPLVLAWLAKCTYPDQFKDYDLDSKIKEYYKTFYNYELTDAQVADMFTN